MKPIFRCSQLPQLLHCSGSATLMPLVKPRAGDDGFEGSMIHWMIADRLIREHGAAPPAGGLAPPSVPAGYVLPKMSRWMVEWALRVVADKLPPRDYMQVEQGFRAEFDRFILVGHMDVHTINRAGTEFHGGDWKSGYKPAVIAELNDQVLGYLGLAKREWPTLESGKFFIGNPRNSEDDGFPRLSTVELTGDQMEDCLTSLNDRVNYALDHPMETDSGLIACAWCPVGIQCPSVRETISYLKATITPEALAAIKATADDGLLGDAVIAARTIKTAVADAEELLKERIAASGAVKSYSGVTITAKTEGGQYKVTNPEGAFAAVQELIPAERVPHVLSYSTSTLIDEIAKANRVNKGGDADITAKTLFDIVLRPHLEQGSRTRLIFTP